MTATLDETELAAPCPMCGTLTGLMLAERSALLAVSDVLVYRSLEVVGKRIVRAERRRFKLLGTRPWHEAHTLWLPDGNTVEKALSGAWDVVPALLSPLRPRCLRVHPGQCHPCTRPVRSVSPPDGTESHGGGTAHRTRTGIGY